MRVGRVRVGGRVWERRAGVAEGLGARGEMTLGPHASRGIAAQNRVSEARPLARMHPLRRVGSTSYPKGGRWADGAGGQRAGGRCRARGVVAVAVGVLV